MTWIAPQSVMLPLRYMRELGVVPAPAPVVAQGPLERLNSGPCQLHSMRSPFIVFGLERRVDRREHLNNQMQNPEGREERFRDTARLALRHEGSACVRVSPSS